MAPISSGREACPLEPARPRGRRRLARPHARAPPRPHPGPPPASLDPADRLELSAPFGLGSTAPPVTSDTTYPPVSDSRCLVAPLFIFPPVRPKSRPHLVSSKTIQLWDQTGDGAARSRAWEVSETCRVVVGYGLRPETEVWKAVLRAQVGSTFTERPRLARHGGGADLKRAGRGGASGAGLRTRRGVAPGGAARRVAGCGYQGSS